jgi:SM-20-related protein
MLETLAEKSWAESPNIWPVDFCRQLALECQRLQQQGDLKKARIGHGSEKSIQTEIRGDFTHWISEETSTPVQKKFLHEMQTVQRILNQIFYLGLNHFESHFALYPAGTGYDRHIDNQRGANARKITFILYLNENWNPGDGGELSLFEPECEEKRLALLPPTLGRFVLFRSEVFPHQVEKSFKPRMSLTGWLRNDAL